MFSRIKGLFQRYERRHRHIEAPGFTLSGAGGDGRVERVALEGNRLVLSGWSTADRLTLTGPAGRVEIHPSGPRPENGNDSDAQAGAGFRISQTYRPGPITLTIETGPQSCDIPVPVPGLTLNRLSLAGQFAWTMLCLVPHLVPALTRYDLEARARVKTALGLNTVTEALPLDPAVLIPSGNPAATPASGPEPGADEGTPVTLVLPVYNAFDLLAEVLDRVLRHTDLPWHLVVVEDCSSDDRVRPWLRDWVAAQAAAFPGRIELVENAANKGFIGSVNAGLERAIARGDHAILLNSDAFVPQGWASRLLRPILDDDSIASVTPMSNDAEIFSVPVLCQRTPLLPGQGDVLDAAAQGLSPEAPLPEAPTGVGFCMALNIRFLRETPGLDPAFGRGYGEEVDWCQKTRQQGGRHVGLPGLFVEHRGGTSFGSEEKLRLIAQNHAIIARRYPEYDAEVQTFIAEDPLLTARLALAVAWAASSTSEPIPVYLAHSLGGGAEHYLQRRIADDLDRDGLPAIVLRVGGETRWQIEVVSPQGMVAGTTADFAVIERLLSPMRNRRIIYSCGVGDPDPVSLPDLLLSLRRGGEVEVLIHDFFVISPSYTLLDADGVYRGPMTAPRTDRAHIAQRPDGTPVSGADWGRAWGRLLEAADDIVVFSDDSRGQVLAACPECADRIRIRPHDMLNPVPRLTPTVPKPGAPRRMIAVLGNINTHKGAGVVAGLGRLIRSEPDFGLVVIGNVDPAHMPPSPVMVHGDYHLSELPELATLYGITDWLIPSIWPETFSYTTHEALATGLPVHAFGIGAQGDAVRQAENGHAIDFDPARDLARQVLEALRGEN